MKEIVQNFSRRFALNWPVDGRQQTFTLEKGVAASVPDDLFGYLMERSEPGREFLEPGAPAMEVD